MEILTPAIVSFSAAAASSLVQAAWQGAVLALGAGLLLRLFPRLGPVARSAIWSTVLLLLMALHFVPPHAVLAAGGSTGLHLGLRIDPRWSVALLALWVALLAIRAAELLTAALRLRTLLRRSRPFNLAAIPARLGSRPFRLLLSPDVDRPSVVGFFAPRILLSESLVPELAPAELEAVVLHEYEHLRRRDDWTNLLQKIALMLFPLNPALLWVERRLCAERELACDDGVLRRMRAPKTYAGTLLRLAEHALLRRSISLVLAAWSRRPELTRRVERILEAPRTAGPRAGTRLATGALLGGLLLSSAALTRSPELVHFRPVTERTASAEMASATAPGITSRTAPAALFAEPALRPRLIQAAFHEPLLRKIHARSHRAVRGAKKQNPSFLGAALTRTVPRPRLLLSRFGATPVPDSSSPRAPRLVLAVAANGDLDNAYAAVPLPDGWLIFQL